MSEANANLVYVCDQWEIDLGRRELRSSGIPVPLGGRAFEVVTVLVQSASEFVTKDHMMDRVWPGATVGEGTLHVHISAVRKALGRTEPAEDRVRSRLSPARELDAAAAGGGRRTGLFISRSAHPDHRRPTIFLRSLRAWSAGPQLHSLSETSSLPIGW